MGNVNSGRSVSQKTNERYISFEKGVGRFRVDIPIKGKRQKNIGRFDELKDAIQARDKTLDEYIV